MNPESTLSPKVAAPAAAAAAIAVATFVAAAAGVDLEVSEEGVAALVGVLGLVQFVVGYFRRDPLRRPTVPPQ